MADYKISKGLIISLVSVVIFIVVAVVLSLTVFVVRNVEVNLLSDNGDYTNEQAESELNNEILLGKSVLFLNKKELTAKIEQNLPKIKVVNLEVKFPNIVRINCEERTPVFTISLVNSTFNYAVIDEDFKVLDTKTSNTGYIDLSFKINSTEYYKFDNLQKGDFVSHTNVASLKNFFRAMKKKGTLEYSVLSLFKTMEVYDRLTIDGSVLCLKCETMSGRIFDFVDIDKNVGEKIVIFLNVYAEPNDDPNHIEIIE